MFDFGAFETFLPLQQSEPYAAAVKACGARVAWHDLGCGQALAVERGRLRLVSRGPVWEAGVTEEERRGALRRLARWPGVTVVTPEEGVSGFGLIPLVTPMHHVVWELGGDLRAGMAGKWRNRLVAAEAAGVGVRLGGLETLERLVAEEGRQRRARGYRALPEGFTRALPHGCLRVWEWRGRGEVGVAMAFVVHGSSATYHLGWASDAARAAGVHGVMLTRAAEALAAEGGRWLDLGSVDTEAAPGLARFKLGTG
ncbi:GNAT family N-acetyltransferase, partial [Tabrizicola sp.]|uniref:GNAT family N-acetyltransferase n=1 Tax=Tabrizicola sp. TaxID=2005166 RepID=UPI003F2C906A